MLKVVRSRLTYANVMATVAVFVALGGGAYALSGVPDRSGIYHGCVATSGALRVVAKASSCRKAKTVKRGKRRVRVPGESAISWNQQGRPGVNGVNGTNGTNGANGTTGVIAGRRDLNNGDSTTTLIDIPGVGTVYTDCTLGGGAARVGFTNHSGNTEDVSFTVNSANPPSFLAADDGVTAGGGEVVVNSNSTILWLVATRGANPKITTISATKSNHGPTACTTFAQATPAS